MRIVIRARYGWSNVAGSHGPFPKAAPQSTTMLQLVGDPVGVVCIVKSWNKVSTLLQRSAMRCDGLQPASDVEEVLAPVLEKRCNLRAWQAARALSQPASPPASPAQGVAHLARSSRSRLSLIGHRRPGWLPRRSRSVLCFLWACTHSTPYPPRYLPTRRGTYLGT